MIDTQGFTTLGYGKASPMGFIDGLNQGKGHLHRNSRTLARNVKTGFFIPYVKPGGCDFEDIEDAETELLHPIR